MLKNNLPNTTLPTPTRTTKQQSNRTNKPTGTIPFKLNTDKQQAHQPTKGETIPTNKQ